MNMSNSEHWLESHAGWGQLFATIVAWIAMAVWITRGLADQAKANEDMARALTAQLANVSDKVSSLAVSTERLAEHVAVYEHDSERRLERLEREHDTTTRGKQ